MAFVRMRAKFIDTVSVKGRFPWSKPQTTEVTREGFLAVNLLLCAEISALPLNQHGIPLIIVPIHSSASPASRGIPHVEEDDYLDMVVMMGSIPPLGLMDLVKEPH